jgi:hypothetical protein
MRDVNQLNYTTIEAFARVHPYTAPWGISKHFGLDYKKATEDPQFCAAVENGIRRGIELQRSKRHEHLVIRKGDMWECKVCGELFVDA